MHWRSKARVQRAIGVLPESIGNPLYYALQRRFGFFRSVDPLEHFRAAAWMARSVERQGRSVRSASVFEVGTGHRLNVPIALWVFGASRIVTFDAHRYLKPALVDDDLAFARDHPDEVKEALDAERVGSFDGSRFAELLDPALDARRLIRSMPLEYVAPADASRSSHPTGGFRLHVSRSVLEHVAPLAMRAILREARRIVAADGLLVHLVDFSDHFAHGDPSVSSINFLRFDPAEWDVLSGNRYMFHNRWRVDDYVGLFRSTGFEVLANDAWIDERALAAIRNGFPVHESFAGKTAETLATYSSLFVLAPEARDQSPV